MSKDKKSPIEEMTLVELHGYKFYVDVVEHSAYSTLGKCDYFQVVLKGLKDE